MLPSKKCPESVTVNLLPIILKFDAQMLKSMSLTKESLQATKNEIFERSNRNVCDFKLVSVFLRLNFSLKGSEQSQTSQLLLRFFSKVVDSQDRSQSQYFISTFRIFFLNSLNQYKNQDALSYILFDTLTLLAQLIDNSCLIEKVDQQRAIKQFIILFLRLYLALIGRIINPKDIQQSQPYYLQEQDYLKIQLISNKIIKNNKQIIIFKMLHYCSLELYLLMFPVKFSKQNQRVKFLATEAKNITKIWKLIYKFNFLENYIIVLFQLIQSSQKNLRFWLMTVQNLLLFVNQVLSNCRFNPKIILRRQNFIKILYQSKFTEKIFNFLHLIQQKTPKDIMQKLKWQKSHCIKQINQLYQLYLRGQTPQKQNINYFFIFQTIVKLKLKDETQNRLYAYRTNGKVIFFPGETLQEFNLLQPCVHQEYKQQQKQQDFQQTVSAIKFQEKQPSKQLLSPTNINQLNNRNGMSELLEQICEKIAKSSVVQGVDRYCFIQTNILILKLIMVYNSQQDQKAIENKRKSRIPSPKVLNTTSKQIYQSIPFQVFQVFLKSLIFSYKAHQINEDFMQKLHSLLLKLFCYFVKMLQLNLLSDKKKRLKANKQSLSSHNCSQQLQSNSLQEIINFEKFCFWISLTKLSVQSNKNKKKVIYCQNCMLLLLKTSFCQICLNVGVTLNYKSHCLQASIYSFMNFEEQCKLFDRILLVTKRIILTDTESKDNFGSKFLLNLIQVYFPIGKQNGKNQIKYRYQSNQGQKTTQQAI